MVKPQATKSSRRQLLTEIKQLNDRACNTHDKSLVSCSVTTLKMLQPLLQDIN